jgi:hypothetical protein
MPMGEEGGRGVLEGRGEQDVDGGLITDTHLPNTHWLMFKLSR